MSAIKHDKCYHYSRAQNTILKYHEKALFLDRVLRAGRFIVVQRRVKIGYLHVRSLRTMKTRGVKRWSGEAPGCHCLHASVQKRK